MSTKPIALVTGASRGIGEAVAKRFAREGMHVVAVARDGKALERLEDSIKNDGGSASMVQLDLTEFPKIDQLAAHISERFGRLDVLVGNAAILGEITPVPHSAPGEWHNTIDINLHANFHLIRCFDPLLRAAPAGRVIMVTSGVAARSTPYWGAYAVSKAALEMMVETYAAENEKTNLRINLFDPGRTRTRMRAQAFPGENPETLPAPESLTDLFVKMAGKEYAETGKIVRAY
ncbi:MAG: SDR family NAD(P)-dependent oxidoreductase [Alphaproteobacteria bacterium]|nr:SDR family NAD(P)-dependent oxidoreductase [Alphaproteobacteria bacterium]